MGTGRGGKRIAGEGKRIGRPPNPVKGLKTSAAIAEQILRDLDYENEITEIYRNCGDYRLKLQILQKLEERAFGPPRKEQEDGKTPADIKVNIRRIGSTP